MDLYHANCKKVDPIPDTVKTVPKIAKHIDKRLIRNDDGSPRPNWIEWHRIMKSQGMVSAANAISRALCSQCDKLNREDRLNNRIGMTMDAIEGSGYNGKAMDAFSKRMKTVLTGQFGRWPRVYEQNPELQLIKFKGTIEEIDEY